MGKTFKPEMQVVRFGNEDVIATSGKPVSVTLSQFGGATKDGSVSYNGTDYALTSKNAAATFFNAFEYAKSTPFYRGESTHASINDLVKGEVGFSGYEQVSANWNGTYLYDASTKRFNKQ